MLVVCALACATLAFASGKKDTTHVTYPSAFGISQRLSDLPIDLSLFPNRVMPEPRPSPLATRATPGPWQRDPVLQTEALPEVGATQGVSFNGIAQSGWIPPDNNLAVGPTEIFTTVNTDVAAYSKTGTLLSGPTNIPTIFAAIGGLCTTYVVDPIVLYDRPADRWIIAGIGDNYAGSYSECVAVSTTNDPAGSYALYEYQFGSTLNDYDKLSVWATDSNSAYLATYNLFAPGGFAGADLCGFDRTKMLAGNPKAAMLCQATPSSEGSYLPSDMDGPTTPVDGTPGLFITWQNNNPGELYLRSLTLNFASGKATLSNATTINVANDNLSCGVGFGTCVVQPGTTQELDTLGDRMMYRFAIRHFADHDRAVFSHAVDNGGPVAIRWYELYDPAGNVTLNQQGTFAPDSTYRWMSSLAEDQSADIALGYSASSSSVYPAIRFTGRVPSDPLGSMETEASIIEGSGSQSGGSSANRWGDYTAMQVDPTDDCTFWYIDEYQPVTGYENWTTRISSFVFPSCGGSGGGPVMSLAPTSLKWGKVAVGVTSGAKKVVATNSGTSTLSITNLATTGDFALVAVKQTKKVTPCANGTNLAPGATCEIKVSFTPTQTGVRTGSVNFTDNASGSPQSVSLTGTGK
ncbi:MAG: choice-of-anchor D domain-containing protein [Terriglobales bacterium]